MVIKKQNIRMLLVDDDEDTYILVKRKLASMKTYAFQIEWVDSYIEGMRRVAAMEHDVYLIDQVLGDGEGLELLTQLSKRAYRGRARIMFTNHADDDLENRALCADVSEFLTKDQLNSPVFHFVIKAAIEREKQRRDLLESEERYSLALRGANDGIWDWDTRTDKLFVSDRWWELTGYSCEEMPEYLEEWKRFVHPDDVNGMISLMYQHFQNRVKQFRYQFRYLMNNGSYIWVMMRGAALRDEDGEVYRMAGSLTDIHQMKLIEEELRHQVLQDPLTELPNRALFYDRVSQAIETSKRDDDYHFAVLFVDLNKFKEVNDTMGHQFGDVLLKIVAQKLASNMRGEDSIARLGGDEFGILCTLVDGLNTLNTLVERIQRSLAAKIKIANQEISISASIGATIGPGEYDNVDDMIRDADIAMYRSKSQKDFILFDHHQHTHCLQ